MVKGRVSGIHPLPGPSQTPGALPPGPGRHHTSATVLWNPKVDKFLAKFVGYLKISRNTLDMDTKIAHKIEMHNLKVQLINKTSEQDGSKFNISCRDQLLGVRADLINHLNSLEPDNPNYQAIIDTIHTFKQPIPFSPKLEWLRSDQRQER